jgi:hypothetical protein
MPAVSVTISRFVDEHQPGFVECLLKDADGQDHTFLEKTPIVSSESLWSDSQYPRSGAIACVIEAEYLDESGNMRVRISTEQPWSVESTAGASRFVVWPSQMVHL